MTEIPPPLDYWLNTAADIYSEGPENVRSLVDIAICEYPHYEGLYMISPSHPSVEFEFLPRKYQNKIGAINIHEGRSIPGSPVILSYNDFDPEKGNIKDRTRVLFYFNSTNRLPGNYITHDLSPYIKPMSENPDQW